MHFHLAKAVEVPIHAEAKPRASSAQRCRAGQDKARGSSEGRLCGYDTLARDPRTLSKAALGGRSLLVKSFRWPGVSRRTTSILRRFRVADQVGPPFPLNFVPGGT